MGTGAGDGAAEGGGEEEEELMWYVGMDRWGWSEK